MDEFKELFNLAEERAILIDKNNDMEDVLDKVKESGILGLIIPKEYNGLGGGYYDACRVSEELALRCSGVAHSIVIHNMAVDAIRLFGNEEQKERYFPKLLKGFGCLAITEAKGGSDVANAVSMRAEKVGNSYILNGHKVMITNGTFGEIFIVVARTGEGARGLTTFIVEKQEGIEVHKINPSGMRGSGLSNITFKDVEVGKEDILLSEGRGLRVALGTLAPNRVPFSAMGLGIAERCLNLAIERAKSRKAFGGVLSDLQAVQFMIAEIAAEVEVLKRAIYSFAKEMDDTNYAGAVCKLKAAEVAKKAADIAVEIYGGYGLIEGTAVEIAYRDAKVLDIAEGASEIMKLLIARKIFS